MTNTKTDNTEGMVGLIHVRKALGLKRSDLGRLTGHHANSIRNLETGARIGTIAGCRELAEALCCEPADLLSVPSADRLERIKDAFEFRKGQEAAARIAARQAEQEKGVA